MPRDRLPHRVEVGVLHERDVLGVELLRQRREPDEVGEEDGYDPPLDRPLGGHRASLTPHNRRHKSVAAASRLTLAPKRRRVA